MEAFSCMRKLNGHRWEYLRIKYDFSYLMLCHRILVSKQKIDGNLTRNERELQANIRKRPRELLYHNGKRRIIIWGTERISQWYDNHSSGKN